MFTFPKVVLICDILSDSTSLLLHLWVMALKSGQAHRWLWWAAPVSLGLWAPPFGGPDPRDDCHKHWGKFTNILLIHPCLLHITMPTYTLVMIMSCDIVSRACCTLHIYMYLMIKILIPFFNDWHELILFDIMILCIILFTRWNCFHHVTCDIWVKMTPDCQ